MTVRYTVRPISDRTTFSGPPLSGDRNPFRRSTWSDTQVILERELWHLDASNVVLEVDVRERDIRVDGALRADARAASPAVRVAFDTPDGPMQFATDRYGWSYNDQPRAEGWKENVRAIALGLEALRKVDRYGITRRREQYTGFRALPAGGGHAPTGMTVSVALQVLRDETNMTADDQSTAAALAGVLRYAKSRTHPDRNNGDRSRWDAVEQAEQVLRRAGRL